MSAEPIDRGMPSVNRLGSLQQRTSKVLAFSLTGLLGAGLLTWYYSRALSSDREVGRRSATPALDAEMALLAYLLHKGFGSNVSGTHGYAPGFCSWMSPTWTTSICRAHWPTLWCLRR
jgi:hypothetical protein